MPYIPPVPPAEAGPTSINPGSSSDSHSYYPFGSVPPNAFPHNPFPQGNGSGHSDLNLERNDSFQFSPIQHEDESWVGEMPLYTGARDMHKNEDELIPSLCSKSNIFTIFREMYKINR